MNTQTTTLQIPLPASLKREAKLVAREQGFSSLQDFMRLILTKLVRREMTIQIGSKDEFVTLSPAAKKRYAKAIDDIKHDRNIVHTSSPEDFLKKLRS